MQTAQRSAFRTVEGPVHLEYAAAGQDGTGWHTAKPRVRNVSGPIKFAQSFVYDQTATHVSATFPGCGDRARDGSR